MSEKTDGEFSANIDVTRLPADGRTLELSACASDRVAIAARLGVDGVEAFSAAVTVTPIADGARVAGAFSARLNRQCVLSLEPMIETLSEPVDVAFRRTLDDHQTDGDNVLGDEDEELLIGDAIDIADLIIQQASLAMAPYPKRADAASLVEDFGEMAESSPFDVLKTLTDAGGAKTEKS